jgi:hypothetical protein
MMKELHDIVTSLLDKDGSCRDLNFEAPTWAGVEDLLGSLESRFGKASGTDQEERAIAAPFQKSVLAAAKDRGCIHLVFNEGVGLIKTLQMFVCSENDGSPFFELTFFPDDVEPTQSLRRDFIDWAHQMQARLCARRYYARYENASWRFGDTGAHSGVFLLSDDVTTDA